MKDFATAAPVPDLLDALSRFRLDGVSGTAPLGPGLFSYCALTRERLISVRLERPVLGAVLSGSKEVWRGLEQERLVAGTLFALPAGVDLDIVNDPDPRRGLYQSLVLEIAPEMAAEAPPVAGPEPSPEPSPAEGDRAAIPLRAELIEAVAHAASAITDGPAAGPVRQARVAELLALLAGEPAARPLFALSTAARVARLVRGELERPWRADAVARALGMSEATLRRRLRAQGRGFAEILREERMRAARRMLAQGEASGVVAAAVGYASRAHFARAYRAVFGTNPSRDA